MKDVWISFLKALVIALCNLFVFGLSVMLLWNAIITLIFNASSITYWQSVGLCVLTNILFKPWSTTDDKD